MTKVLFLLLLLVMPWFLNAQNIDSTQNYTLNDSLLETTKFDLLMISLSYSSNNIKYKNLDNSIKMPTLSADVNYFHKSGIWASIDYTNYFQATEHTYETEFMLGYQKSFNKFIDVDFNYGYHHFEGEATYEGISYDHSLSGTLGLNSKYVTLTTDVYYLNGLTNNYFLDLGLSLNLDFDNVIFQNDFFMFTPGLTGHFGTDDWIFEDYTPMQYQGRRRFLSQQGYKTGSFEYQSFGIYLPLIYSYSNVSLSLNWFYDFPSAKLQSINWVDQGGFLISIIYSPIL